MKVVIFTRKSDGGLTVIVPCVSQDDPKDFTPQQALERSLKKDIPEDAMNIGVIDYSRIPSERTFRNAWMAVGDKVDVDMPKAREIWREKMRLARAPKLADLDIEYQRADESGDNVKKAQIVAKKNQLRGVTDLPEIESAKTPDELKAVWPKELD